ncbi:MAG: bifunctional 5,10-methylenetetrahydrofolate dehydrogenase/5,10-methenyltetrahydrofolate cyclohydrolase [Dehalococcoidia bacterium]
MNKKIIDGKKIALKATSEIKDKIVIMSKDKNLVPGLAVILIGENPASISYVKGKEKACKDVGIFTKTYKLSDRSNNDVVSKLILSLNKDNRFHGILIQLPLPKHLDSDKLINLIDPKKDVDGLTSENAGLLLLGKPRFVPATPLGVQKLMLEENIEIKGSKILIIGRSNLVGLPLSLLLLGKGEGGNATVTVAHTETKNLEQLSLSADIVIVASGQPNTLSGNMVKENSIIIDVGVSRLADQTKKTGYRLIGDVNFDEVINVASKITPVPGGVGPMTIAMLLHNVYLAATFSIKGPY